MHRTIHCIQHELLSPETCDCDRLRGDGDCAIDSTAIHTYSNRARSCSQCIMTQGDSIIHKRPCDINSACLSSPTACRPFLLLIPLLMQRSLYNLSQINMHWLPRLCTRFLHITRNPHIVAWTVQVPSLQCSNTRTCPRLVQARPRTFP